MFGLRKVTGVKVERVPNYYIIKVFKHNKIIEQITYTKAGFVLAWFQCLSSAGYDRKIKNYGRKYFREHIKNNIDRWIAEDECMTWALEKFGEFYGQQ